jgi:hypothetical protein
LSPKFPNHCGPTELALTARAPADQQKRKIGIRQRQKKRTGEILPAEVPAVRSAFINAWIPLLVARREIELF